MVHLLPATTLRLAPHAQRLINISGALSQLLVEHRNGSCLGFLGFGMNFSHGMSPISSMKCAAPFFSQGQPTVNCNSAGIMGTQE